MYIEGDRERGGGGGRGREGEGEGPRGREKGGRVKGGVGTAHLVMW